MTNVPKLTGVLLAGGQSRRMGGGDKCLAKIGAKTMLEHVIERLRPQVARLVINANGQPERFAHFNLPVEADTIGGFAGPLAGVLSGMQWSRRNIPDETAIVTAATDAPLLPRDLVVRLLHAADGHPKRIVLAQSGGRTHSVIGLWPVGLAGDLKKALEDGVRKVLDWTDRHDTVCVTFPFERIGGVEIDPFFNANRPDELDKAQKILKA